MTATKRADNDLDVQILEDTVRGMFAGKNAFVGSRLVSAGAVVINDQMPGGRDWIGNEITVPFFGVIGDFADNPEDTAVTPSVLKSTHEKATVARSSLAFEVTKWARGSSPNNEDPYEECSRQIRVAAEREIDRLCVAAAAGTPLVNDVYSASSPVNLDYDVVVDSRAKWGDEQADIVGMVVHSRVEAGLRKLKSANGDPLLVDNMRDGNFVTTLHGIPVIVSDRVPLTGSSMSSVTEAGTTPPDFTISGTPLGPWNLKIVVTVGGARGTFKFKFSTDGGQTYSAELTSAASVDLIDTAGDSLVGVNGKTGLTVAIENASADTDNVYTATAKLKATSLILQKGALAFWFNRNAMSLETDKDILKHNDVAAMHLYYAAHRYRRRIGGSKPGVVAITHNVPGFVG